MKQYTPHIICAVLLSLIGGIAGTYIQNAAMLPWWFSALCSGVGAGLGVFAGQKIAENRRSAP